MMESPPISPRGEEILRELVGAFQWFHEHIIEEMTAAQARGLDAITAHDAEEYPLLCLERDYGDAMMHFYYFFWSRLTDPEASGFALEKQAPTSSLLAIASMAMMLGVHIGREGRLPGIDEVLAAKAPTQAEG